MIRGIGVDIVEITRIAKLLDRWGDRFVRKILSEEELAVFGDRGRDASFLSRQFAAKEAASKALGTGMKDGVHFRDISVLRDQEGCPFIQFSEASGHIIKERSFGQFHVSISDEREYAIAYVVAEGSFNQAAWR